MVGIAVVLAEGLNLSLDDDEGRKGASVRRYFVATALCAVFSFVIVQAAWHYPKNPILPPLAFTGNLTARFPHGVPVVFDRIDLFDMMVAEGNEQGLQSVCLLDWPSAISAESPRGQVSGYHVMENWRRMGYYSAHILDSEEFLRNTSQFYVVNDPENPWMKQRILN